jgi:hypothetical protein
MCFGGGGSAATITMPDTGAYEREFELQRSAIQEQINSKNNLLQQELTTALRNKEGIAQQASDAKRQIAENTSAQAMRMASLIGTPPPEKSAEAPAVGRNRGTVTSKGKGALRIERSTATSASQGAGLNIASA